MGLPTITRCCCGLSLERGCLILTMISILACIGNIAAGSSRLPDHRNRQPEDNLISMSMVMFSTLSLVSNFITIYGISKKHPDYIQCSFLFNFLFVVFNFLVSIVTCIFSPEFTPYLRSATMKAVIVIALLAGAAYSLYFMAVVNSLYRKMKLSHSTTAIPV